MTSPRKLIVIGGGAHARVVIEAARSRPAEWEVVGFADPELSDEAAARVKARHFRSDADALRHVADAWYVLGIGRIGTAALRQRIASYYWQAGARWARIVHSAAWISPSAEIADGAVVLAGAVINAGAAVGPHSTINSAAVVEHDSKVGAFVFVAPGVVMGGDVEIGDDSYLGLGCRVRDNICIGRGAVIGMGAVVTKNVPAGVKALGVPARIISEQHADRS